MLPQCDKSNYGTAFGTNKNLTIIPLLNKNKSKNF